MKALASINNSAAVKHSPMPHADNATCADNYRKLLTYYFIANFIPL
jgi:hypothetical protein